MEKAFRRRVYLFISRRNGAAGQILVLSSPDAHGAETPGGTVEAGESPVEAALREAEEETGLSRFETPALVAEDDHENRDERLRRFFFHLPVLEPTTDAWRHRDGHSGTENVLRWVDLPDAVGLDLHFRAYLDRVSLSPAEARPQ